MNKFSRIAAYVFTFGAAVVLSGCNGGGANTGKVSFSATDAPVDGVTQVQITFTKVELKPAQGSRLEFDLTGDMPNGVSMDLLGLQGTASELILDQTVVPAGRYNYVRLYVQNGFVQTATGPEGTFVEDTSGYVDLLLPGQQAGADDRFVQLNTGFNVPVGGAADFTIDFDLRKALTKPVGANYYLLRPALRLVDNLVAGSIYGTVPETLIANSCANVAALDRKVSVYIYDANDSDPLGDIYIDENGVDISAGESRPLATTNVTQNGSGGYEYTFGFVVEGSYNLGLTCKAGLDVAENNDDIVPFSTIPNVQVVTGEETTANF